jgi:uncharacterized protein YkwD
LALLSDASVTRASITLLTWVAFFTLVAGPTPAFAAGENPIRDAVNEMRTRGCGGRPGLESRLRQHRGADELARALSRGARLREVAAGKSYRALRSASIHVSRAVDDAAVKRTLRAQFCSEATDPDFVHIGVVRQGRDAWVVVARPFDPPSPDEAPKVSRKMLELVNEARSHARRCGSDAAPAAPPVTLDTALERAARDHARDVARRGAMSHTGSDGSTPPQRATRANYAWRAVGENIAAGQTTPEAAVKSWLESPGHCVNLMSPRFTEMGVAYVIDLDSPDGIYWVQVFGTPAPR